MLSIPTEVLPRFCPDPRSVAALAGTCSTIAARLWESRPIFKMVANDNTSAAAKSEYFTYTFRGLRNQHGSTMTFYEIIEMAPMWLFRFVSSTLSICTNPSDVLAMRSKHYNVYQLHAVSTTLRLWGRFGGCSETFALGNGSKYDDLVFRGLCPVGALVYKRIRDSFCNFER